jgi:hypothetical protein
MFLALLSTAFITYMLTSLLLGEQYPSHDRYYPRHQDGRQGYQQGLLGQSEGAQFNPRWQRPDHDHTTPLVIGAIAFFVLLTLCQFSL